MIGKCIRFNLSGIKLQISRFYTIASKLTFIGINLRSIVDEVKILPEIF